MTDSVTTRADTCNEIIKSSRQSRFERSAQGPTGSSGSRVAALFVVDGHLLHKRIHRVLAIARAFGHAVLVLGAWGCGAFENDPYRFRSEVSVGEKVASTNGWSLPREEGLALPGMDLPPASDDNPNSQSP
jgi:hypothetical protein